MNDGNDSNFQRDLVEKTAQQYDDYFFNTSMPIELDTFSGPVVLTINPNKMTDDDFYKLEKIPHNLMFVRIRVNMWNQDTVVDPAVLYYTKKGCPVVLTYMAYYQETIPEEYKHWYQWEKRTTNSYWVLTKKGQEAIESDYEDELLVYTCGRRGHHACFLCGNCLREYYNAKERMRALKEK